MRKWLVLGILVLLLLAISVPVQAAGPFDEPPGLDRAIAAKEQHKVSLLKTPGVTGVAVSVNGENRSSVVIFTERAGVRGLPAFLDNVPVTVAVSGKFSALAKPVKPPPPPAEPFPWERWGRPVPIGVSTGHPDITAGTIGARVRDAAGNVYALSNNHVYANENTATIGDTVLQPGPYDGGTLSDGIGTLSAFQPINFAQDGTNTIDAAIALSSAAYLGKATPANGYGLPKSATTTASLRMKVQKYGRTTGLTNGQVYAINATVKVGYDSGVATFDNQVVVTPGNFSAGGDSGSLIVVNNKRSVDHRKPVALLFAGSSSYTIANPINEVLSYFGVVIDGE